MVMFNMKGLSVGVVTTGAALFSGYSYMQKREKGQENTLLKAMEDIYQIFTKGKNDWEETKDKVIERLRSQEEKVKGMEEERKTRDVKLLGMEKRLQELEAEEKRTCLGIAALKEERAETNTLEESPQLGSEDTKDETKTTEVKALNMEWTNEVIESLREELKGENTKEHVGRLDLIIEKEALAEQLLRAVPKNKDMMKTTESKVLKMDTFKDEEDWREECEGSEEEEERFKLISAEHNDDVNKGKTIEDKVLKPENCTTQFCELTLDPNTANSNLSLSDNYSRVTRVRDEQPYPDHPDQFDYWSQVLCREGLTGRCYWEVGWSLQVSIAVAYGGIKRRGRGDGCLLGYNDMSWSLECYDVCKSRYEGLQGARFIVRHNRTKIKVPVGPSGNNRVGVYLDWPAGILSFYSVSSDTRTHLHTFRCTFSEPLYCAFWCWMLDSSVFLCPIKEVQQDSLSMVLHAG